MVIQTAYTQPCITLLFSEPELHLPSALQLAMDFSSVEGSPHPENIEVNVQLQQSDKLAAELVLLEHHIKILGAGMQLPKDVMARCLQAAHWQGNFKSMLASHKSQMVLSYSGPSKTPLEKMMMLYKTAYALRHESLIGIVNENAWTAHPVLDTLEPARIRSYRESIPFLLWFGYLKIPLTETLSFLATKGHGVFNMPELAFLIEAGEDSSAVLNTFFNVVYYMLGNHGAVKAGDTLEVSGANEYLRFNAMPDLPGLEQWRINPEATLMLERIQPGEVENNK